MMGVPRCGIMDVGAVAPNDGPNAWRVAFGSPSKSALDGEIPQGKLRRPTPTGVADSVIDPSSRARRNECGGVVFRLTPNLRRRCSPEIRTVAEAPDGFEADWVAVKLECGA